MTMAVIGDLHGSWSDADVHFFNQSCYDLLLFTGDLGSGTKKNGVDIARSVARLKKPALVVAGNNDAPFADGIAAEFSYERGLAQLMKLAPVGRSLGAGNVRLCGYDSQTFQLGQQPLTIIIGRPFALGGDEWSFPELLNRLHGVRDPTQSVARFRRLIDEAPADRLLFLAHNGPTGFGDQPDDMWGCDFKGSAGDWGDSDLHEALEHAKRRGKRVLAVVAGHMHRGASNPGRCASVERDGTLYVNAACVPRIFGGETGMQHHHMVLDVGEHSVSARDVFVDL